VNIVEPWKCENSIRIFLRKMKNSIRMEFVVFKRNFEILFAVCRE